MKPLDRNISRRDFLKSVGLISAGVLLPPNKRQILQRSIRSFSDFPVDKKLGRICVAEVSIRSEPSANAPAIGTLYEDDVVEWIQEVVGEVPDYRLSRHWVKIPEGYVYAPSVQPVKNIPNVPVSEIPYQATTKGMWAEVTQPYVDVKVTKYPPEGFWLKENYNPRLYYSQVMWIDDMRTEDGVVEYLISDRYGSRGDKLWGPAEAFRPLTEEEISPIHPDVGDKKVRINLNQETLSCYEGKNEVYFCQISAGTNFDDEGNPAEESKTPVGARPIWRKLISIHMEGGTAGGGYDLPGVPWTCLFVGEGVAIHSTFWHNDYGAKRSHGCINASPEDAKWIFRWTDPQVPYDPGDVTVSMPGGTTIEVVEN